MKVLRKVQNNWSDLINWLNGHSHLIKRRRNIFNRKSILDDFKHGGSKWKQYLKAGLALEKKGFEAVIAVYYGVVENTVIPLQIAYIVIEPSKQANFSISELGVHVNGIPIYNKKRFLKQQKAVRSRSYVGTEESIGRDKDIESYALDEDFDEDFEIKPENK